MNAMLRWIALVLLLLAGLPRGTAAATNTIWIAVPWSPGSKGLADLQAAARDVSKKTEGRVQVKFVEQHDLESRGPECDGAMLVGPYLAPYSSASRVLALPLLFHSSAEVDQIRATLDSKVAAELEAHGFAVVALLDLGFAYLHSTAAMETVDQFKASKLWVPPAAPEAIRGAESYGITQVPLEATQVREALRQGTVEMVMVPPLGAILLQWHTEIKSVVGAPFVCLFSAVVLRNEAVEPLDGSDRSLLREELARAFSAAAGDLRQKESEALDVLVQNGVVRHPLGTTPEQRSEWNAWAVVVADRLASEGIIPADVLAEARQALSEFRATP